jgi:hypothetical protein
MSKAVETRHPSYEIKEYEWRQMRDTADGASSVKRSAALYLPVPAAMFQNPSEQAGVPNSSGFEYNRGGAGDRELINRAPWNHPIAAYSAYLQRARFPDIVSSTKIGLMGVATKKQPTIDFPSELKHLEEKATTCGLTLSDFYKKCIDEVLTTGRFSFLIDIVDNKPYFVPYVAESFINWKQDGDKVKLAVFETYQYGNDDDEFSQDVKKVHFVGRINTDGDYESQKYVDGVAIEDPIVPSLTGKKFERVPLVVVNATDLGTQVDTTPMLGISDIAISIYQKEADMANSEFVTCNPMLVFIGIDAGSAPSVVGSNVAFAIPDSDGDAKYVEPAANCLQHMSVRIENLFKEATMYGAALLGGSNRAESTETTRMKQEASGASLKTIVDSVEKGIHQGLNMILDLTNSNSEYTFIANKEFTDLKLTAPEITALVQSWLNKGISYESYFSNMKKGGYIPEDRTIDEERSMIEKNPPMMSE